MTHACVAHLQLVIIGRVSSFAGNDGGEIEDPTYRLIGNDSLRPTETRTTERDRSLSQIARTYNLRRQRTAVFTIEHTGGPRGSTVAVWCGPRATNDMRHGADVTKQMTKATRAFAAVAVVGCAISMWACNGSPTTPGTASPAFTVSGTVFRSTPSGTEGIEGVWVAEPNSFRGAMSDRNGLYSIAGFSAGSITLSASKSSYYVSTRTLQISANTSQDIELVEVVE